MLRRSIVIALAVLVTLGLAVAPSAAQRATWSAGELVAPEVGGFTDVSCVSATWCRAGGAHGTIWSYDGHSWTSGRRLATGPLASVTAIDCTSTRFCVAAVATGRFAGNLAVFDGSHWRSFSARRTGLGEISCVTSAFCLFVTSFGPSLKEQAYRVWNGSSWSPLTAVAGEDFVDGVSCWAVDRCRIVTDRRVLYFDGARLSERTLPANSMQAIDCPTADFCVIVTTGGKALTLRDGRWSGPRTITSPSAKPSGVDCPTTGYCVALTRRSESLVYYADRDAWTSPNAITGEHVGGFSCPTTGSCHAVTVEGSVLTRTPGGWSGADPVNPAFGTPTAISCATTTDCVLVDATGGARRLHGSAWSAPTRIVAPDAATDVDSALKAVSCPTTTFCAAGTMAGAATVLRGGAWSAPQQLFDQYLVGLSCADPDLCVAVGVDRGVRPQPLVQFWDGRRWGDHEFSVADEPVGVSCVDRQCLIAFGRGAVTRVDADGHPDGSVADVPGYVRALSCASSSFCLAVGFHRDGSRAAFAYDGTSWTDVGASPLAADLSVSCAASTLCAAVGPHEAALYDGTSWGTSTRLGSDELTGVSCRSTQCRAIDDAGYVYTGGN